MECRWVKLGGTLKCFLSFFQSEISHSHRHWRETHARPCLKEGNKNMSACWVDLSWQSCDHTPDYKTAFCMSMNTEVDWVRPIGCHGSPIARQWFPWQVGVKSSQFRIQDHILAGLHYIFLNSCYQLNLLKQCTTSQTYNNQFKLVKEHQLNAFLLLKYNICISIIK